MKTPSKMWVLVVFAVTACDLVSQASSTTVAVSTLLSTPTFEVGPGAAGLDAGGLVDAGLTVPRVEVVYAFLGHRPSGSLEVAPDGIPGAKVTLSTPGSSFGLVDQGGGNYALPLDAGFTYLEGATYDFTFVSGGVTYVAEVAQVPAQESIAQFHPLAGFVALDAGVPLTFTRPDPPAGVDRPLGFVEVYPISAAGSRGDRTYSNIPTTPLGFLKLVVASSDWKVTTVTIPGSAFPAPGSSYLVVFQAAKLGGPKSANLFSGSPVLAGTADLAWVRTAP